MRAPFLVALALIPPACRAKRMPFLPRGGAGSPTSGWRPTVKTPNQSWQQQSQGQSQQHPQVTIYDDKDEDISSKEMIESFLTRDSRNKFIARVYMILAGQLLVTAASCMWFGMNRRLAHSLMMGNGKIIPWLGIGMSTIASIWMASSADARRKAPMKWNLLAMFTLGEAFVVGLITSLYKSSTVVSAMMATALATTAVSGYTYFNRNSKYDLSQWGAGLSSAGIIFVVYGLLGLFKSLGFSWLSWLPYNEMAFSGLGAALFSMYLAYHTRLVVGGKHAKFQFHEDDYVFGAMTLYSDIVNIFLYILRILGEDGD